MKVKGFTLIELLVTVAIIGILAMIALPSYQEYMRSSKRADAKATVLKLILAQQKFRGNCAHFAQSLGAADACGASGSASTIAFNALSPEGYYKITVTGASGVGYKITATPQGTQAQDTACSPMTLTVNAANPDGLKAPADCW